MQICEVVDQIIDYFLKNKESLKAFQILSSHDKPKYFSDILKINKNSNKNYKVKSFIQDLAFLIQSFLNVSDVLDTSSDIQLIPYLISSLFFEISEFKCLPPEGNEKKEKINFSFSQKTKLSNYLYCLLEIISEDQELIELLLSTNAFEIIESLRKILKYMIEIFGKYDISQVEGPFKEIISWIMKTLRVFFCEKNLIFVTKLIQEDNLDKMLTFLFNDYTAKEALDILTLMVKFGSIDLTFQNFMQEKKVLKAVSLYTKKIELLLPVLDLNFYFEFPSFDKNDIVEIQKRIKAQLNEIQEDKGPEFINKIYQLSFCDFNLFDNNVDRKKNSILSLQKEKNDKYIRQNFMEKIVRMPSFIEVIIILNIYICLNYFSDNGELL